MFAGDVRMSVFGKNIPNTSKKQATFGAFPLQRPLQNLFLIFLKKNITFFKK